MRDSAGAPLAGAEVTIDKRSVTTTAQGAFRLDSVEVGDRLITIRLVGYVSLRSPVVVRAGVRQYNFVLRPATPQLPTLVVEARRSGIYGTVGDTSYQPLAGVKVQVAGKGGGEAVTDSSGHFAFPHASRGQYVVRTVHPGYAGERLFVELDKGDGVELAIRLRRSPELPARVDEVAIYDLGRRLVANLPGDRLNGSQLKRYETLPLCDVPGIAGRLRAAQENLTIVLNGTFLMEKRSVRDLCSWNAAEVELVEFGENVCRDLTSSLPDMLNVWCTRSRERPAGGRIADPAASGGRIQRAGGPFVVIWERR